MSLTVAERNHWKERIARRIDQRIETLVARQDPVLLQRVAEQARAKAYASLGIDAQQRELEAIRKEEIERRECRLRAEQRAVINGAPVEVELEPTGSGGRTFCSAGLYGRETNSNQAAGVDVLPTPPTTYSPSPSRPRWRASRPTPLWQRRPSVIPRPIEGSGKPQNRVPSPRAAS